MKTPKHQGFLNTLHQTLGDDLTSRWGRVEEFLAAGEQEIAHTKPFFFPIASAATYTDSHLEVDQRIALEHQEQRMLKALVATSSSSNSYLKRE
ncbi:hypothetical protein Taro_032542 [Colocasia esculenta]|uniref:Uncharacterized protein n=1 Tax=Colocasia esculenta TaxID=4460 RepID=A0A843VRL4_COLES|nr:hypothetical protein [Colocasia esculenta]